MNKVPEERRRVILTQLKQSGYMSVTELAGLLFVSVPTVRRDLSALEKEGVLIRTHGGASYLNEPSVPPSYAIRRQEHHEEKMVIGKLATKLIQHGDSIFIESSTTCQTITRLLPTDIKLKILTNGIRTTYRLKDHPNILIEICCGTYDPKHENVFGPEAMRFIATRHADFCFLSCNGMDASGLSSRTQKDDLVKRAMAAHSDKTVLLMDSSKASQTFYYHVFDWRDVDILITDKTPPDDILQSCSDAHVEIITPLSRAGIPPKRGHYHQ